jgi:hypothetical protein
MFVMVLLVPSFYVTGTIRPLPQRGDGHMVKPTTENIGNSDAMYPAIFGLPFEVW